MKNKGPIILFVFILVLILTGYFGREVIFNKKLNDTSDATGNTEVLNWAGDGYLGYSFLRSVEMKKRLAKNGLSLKFNDDNGDYPQRLQKFNNKEYAFIVLPINSYLEHGFNYKYPGVIVAGICESKGADAIVGFEDIMPNNVVNDLNNPDIKIVFTPASPSSFLLDLTIADFDLDQLRGTNSWKVEVNGSQEAYEYAKKAVKDRTVGDAFVMWEPEVTMAINKLGLKKLWGSDQFAGYIIDVIVFHRDVVAREPEKVEKMLETYFGVTNYYTSRPDEMVKEFSKISDLNNSNVESMIKNINWFSLNENCSQLFDIPVAIGMPSRDGLINSIYACSDVLYRTGSLTDDIEDPYKLMNSSFVEKLKEHNITSANVKGEVEQHFDVLTDQQWLQLAEIGTMRVEPITFQSGTSELDFSGEETVDKVAQMLITNYPSYRVMIKGHTGKGDEQQNKILSKERADIVRQRLIGVHGIDPNRLYALGEGANKPPTKKPGENIRAYYLRWARVEFILLGSDKF